MITDIKNIVVEEKIVKQDIVEQEKEPGSFRLIFTLSFAGFLSGLILVGIFLFTKPIIEKNKAEALRIAIFKVIPGTTSFKNMILDNGRLIEVDEKNTEPEKIFLGFNNDKQMTGFALHGREVGFQDVIGVIFGYNGEDKSIIGYEVLECKETPGLGDKIFKDEAFVSNIIQLKVEPEIILVKKGERKNSNEVEAISGATISCKAVVRLMNKSVEKWKLPIADYLKENQIGLTVNNE
jgi:Na+-translocating ferredoxin:NAD+ oxidoreductase subunit G